MATIRPRGKTFYVDYIAPDGERVRKSLGTHDRHQAEIDKREIELALLSGKALSAAVPTFAEYAEDVYLPWHRRQYPDSHFRTASIVRIHLRPIFGHLPLDQVTSTTAEDWLDGRVRSTPPPKHSTLATELRVLKATLNHAVDGRAIPHNPVKRVRVPGHAPSKPKAWWTPEQLASIYAAETQPVWRWVWQLLAHTGMRRGEAMWLPWAEAHADSIHVLSTEQRRTKSAKWRDIPLSSGAKEALEKLKELVPGGYVLPRVNINTLTRAAERTIKRAGFTGSVHSFRHTFISNLVRKGVPLRVVQALAGHASITTTEGYAHLNAKDKAEAVKMLDSA